MKNIRGFAFGLMLAMATVFATVGSAQQTKPADPPKKTESCCAMTSCCCKGDSCSMSNHSKHDSTKQHQSKDGCCCCSGDSCDINMKNKQKQG